MKIKFRVPATTANLGPGFDVFGAALTLYNEFSAEFVPNAKKTKFILSGHGKESIPKGKDNLLWKAMSETFNLLGETKYNLKNLNIEISTKIPLNGGLGSSATAIVGGISLANKLCKNKLNKSQIAELAIKIEGHPDNVVPAIFGGLCACAKNKEALRTTTINLPLPKLKVILCVPSFEIRTNHSRQIIPKNIPLQDVVFNISRVALLTAAFCSNDYSLLKEAMQDKIHQPYRGKMIPAMNKVLEKALNSGAYGGFLSGSGSTLAAFCSKENSENVKKNMLECWKTENVIAKGFILDFDKAGATRI
ncbi:MAG: homoserine kinase [Elusimicrobiota bacterium]|jgi:homoserine kinase|nr:homoserine kinase [Elusimicrobiota bacterium]